MLFLATAILSASIHFAGAVDAPVVPGVAVTAPGEPGGPPLAETAPPPRADEPATVDTTPGLEQVAVCRALATAEPSSTTGARPSTAAPDLTVPACLAELAGASSPALSALGGSFDPVGDDASRLSAVLTAGADAPTTAAWWAGLDDSRRLGLVAAVPGVVGQLEGVPYDVRDQANRLFLGAATLALHDRDETAAEQDGDDARSAMLGQVQLALADRSAGDEDRQLIALDTVMPGRAAVSVGSLDTADDVSVLVPGMFFTVHGQMVDWAETAGQLHDEQRAWTYLLARSDARPLDSVAVVAWMGYRTPDLTNVYTLDLARQGAGHLEDALSGLDAARASDAPRVTVVAHSYGSTTATLALSSGRVSVDSLALLGSPGSVVPTAAMLSVADDDVYAAAGSFDPVAGSGYFGVDPGTGAFGAVLLHTGGGDDSVTGRVLRAALGHNDYLLPGTESMRSLALIALGHGDMVDGDERSPGEPRPDGPELALVRPQDVYLRD
ncbi:hypothetical protein ABID92_002235 [Frigoribacterium sp. PvP120]|uniref:alpha/beta hydrolase n=1 Tax=unclassified Frigoribacterium TaxID=2627005 RepID=UPI001AE54500|nr:alpha/beta hydrolase [Frigoribacterium sp. PvP121]MBP1242443.1 hypothetical protein [Frigoribacterium sp. PvP121]